MAKRLVLAGVFLLLNLAIALVSAIELDISKKPISDTIITDLDKPAVFELTIRNLGEGDNFEIYSVVGLDITPEGSFFIASGDKKTITMEVRLQEPLEEQTGVRAFEYKIKDSKNKVQKDMLNLNLIKLEDAFSITPESINPQSETISVSVKNRAKTDFDKVELTMKSIFFDYKTEISLKSLEAKELTIPLNKEEIKTMTAGSYLTAVEINTGGKKADEEFLIKFLEQEGIDTQESQEGLIIKRTEILKKNVGNTRKSVEIRSEKNMLSYLFTTLNTEPSQTAFQGFAVQYLWEKELIPNEELKVIIKTNWLYPIIVIILIVLTIYLIKRYVETDLMLKKKVSFVKTKGGQFALKITLKLKAKKFIERISVIDKLPHLVNLYNKFGAIAPHKIDLNNRRLEWNVEFLNKDEERIFSYIIYSKVGVVGRFELPEAKATYEKEGKVKHSVSNRSFFVNEPAGS